jgi:hypothetical protein
MSLAAIKKTLGVVGEIKIAPLILMKQYVLYKKN